MPTIDLVLPKPHPNQARVIDEAARFNVLACGRRFGKTTLGIDRLIGPALEGYPVAWFSPTYKMLTEVWRETRRVVAPVVQRPNVQEHRLELVTGGVIDMWSLDSADAPRGRKYKRVVVDEAAMVRDLGDAWNAVIRPMLADYSGDGWFLSTPKGRNFFATMFAWGQEQTDGWRAWQMPTAANPYIPADEIAAMKAQLPERTYLQEVDAAFLEDGGGVFRRVRDAASAPWPVEPYAGTFVMGVDWGKSHDWTVLVVIDAASKRVVDFDRFNQIDYHVQRQRLTAMAGKWNVASILAEQNSIGVPNIEELQRARLPVRGFTTTNATKAEVVEGLALAIETGELAYPPIPELVNELMAYELDRLPSGVVRYGAPPGMHDDCVIALALAWEGARTREKRRVYGF